MFESKLRLRMNPNAHVVGQQTSKTPATQFFDREARIWESRYRSRTYAERKACVTEAVRREVASRNVPAREIELLDFGCGTGVLLEEVLNLGVKATEVDTSKAMIDAARARLGVASNQVRLEWLSTDSGAGHYAERKYDIVLCISVLEFVEDAASILAPFVLNPEGGWPSHSIRSKPEQYPAPAGTLYASPSDTLSTIPRGAAP